jgi:hypothetical protein
MRELLFALRNHDGRKGGEPNRAPGVRFRWTAVTAPRYCGPAFGCFRHFGVQGFEMCNDMKPSPFELATAEKPMRLDLAPRVLWVDDCCSSLHTIWARSICAILGATLLSAISCQPLIFSYGWIRTVNTIIFPARLILSPKRTSSMRCAWVLLVQPADLDILMPKTSNVANIRLHGG